MDAETINATKAAMRDSKSYIARAELEEAERWDAIVSEMPYLRFPADWEVAVVPPFAGAVARFLVKRGASRVSVYCDYYDRLGWVTEPYWEIYPDASGEDCARFLLAETDQLIAGIGAALDASDSDTRP